MYKGRRIALFSERDPAKLDWASAGAEYVIESTGKFKTVAQAGLHLATAKKVSISAMLGGRREDVKVPRSLTTS